jgi:hypothetical protein
MAGTMVENKACATAGAWRQRIAEQERSGLSVKQFCKGCGVTAWSFYYWRKRLRASEPVRFALVERGAERQEPGTTTDLEVMFTTGERLRIRSGVDSTTLRTVLRALRG